LSGGAVEEQSSIRSGRVSRIVALAGTGAKVGMNYARHYGGRAVGRTMDPAALHAANAEDVYATFSKLKGGPLKVAQMLSIDQGLLPPAYGKVFAQAQYSAPPLSYPLVVRTFRREFGKEPLEMFDTFEPKAAHGASIGQVHRASKGGRDYAVKVQYPGVAESLSSDLRVVKPVALQLLGLRERDVAAYFREVEERLLEETDYALELARSVELSEQCAGVAGVRFPGYCAELSSARVLTMDWVDGIPLDRFADGDASQEDRDRIGQALWDFYEYQIHELHVFHADPHPGNFLVKDGALWVLDFGCVKRIEEDFYRRHFAFLDPRLTGDPARLEAALEAMNVLLPTDSPDYRRRVMALCAESIEMVALPFRTPEFDFGSEEFLQAIYQLGLENRDSGLLKESRGVRGSADSIYVNRAYFGLYSLLSRLRARVRTRLPEWISGI
jgi:predicted unusual protein kinase regulating ubiquinone biosynthesis (AarF/ABC1/UbiB family)